jgi:L-ribulose-5-phosphate 3-epimerase
MARRKTKGLSKAISYWSFPGGMENRADVISVLSRARELGFSAVELGISDTGVLTLETTRSECRALARAAEAAGLDICSLTTNLYWATSLSAPRAAERKKAVEMTRLMIERASWLKAGALVVVPGWVHAHFNTQAQPVPYDEALAYSRESLKKCVKTAEKHRVSLALLNAWSGLLLSPVELAGFIDKLRSKRVSACLDTGTAALNGHPQHWIKILGKRLCRVRVRDLKRRFERNSARSRAFRGFTSGQGWGFMAAYCDPGAGSVEWPAVATALKKARYKGPLVSLSHPPTPGGVERSGEFLDKLIGMT